MNTFNPQIDEINKLVNILIKQDLYIELFNIDLTSLNSKYGYEITSKYKQSVIEKITHIFGEELIYTKSLGGKILTITTSKLDSSKKSQIDKECQISEEDKIKYLFINEKIIKQDSLPYKKLLEKYLAIEIYLTQKRENIQKVLSEIKTENELKKISNIWEETIQKFKTINIDIDKSNSKQLIELSKHSMYLKQAINAFSQIQIENNKDTKISINNTKLELVVIQNTLAYKIWFESQEILFQSYKTEKISTNIEVKKNEYDKNKIEFKFKNQDKFILDWFNASIKSLYPYFNQAQLNTSTEIEKELIELLKKNENEIKKIIPKVLEKITKLKDTIRINGFQSIPLDNLIISKDSRTFISRQIHLNFNPKDSDNWKKMINQYYQNTFLKEEYKGFVKGDAESIFQSTKVLNKKMIENNKNQYINFGFLEIDFFNAFNSYFFPTDTDKFYNKIIDTIFKIANLYIIKNSNLFKTLNIGLLGDEFFFLFLTKQVLTNKEESIIKTFLQDINNEILEVTKTNLLIKTQKKKIIRNDKQEITIRVPIEKTSIFSTQSFEIGKISISKYLMINYKTQIQQNNFEEFNRIYNHLDYKIKKVKENKITSIQIDDFKRNENKLLKIKTN